MGSKAVFDDEYWTEEALLSCPANPKEWTEKVGKYSFFSHMDYILSWTIPENIKEKLTGLAQSGTVLDTRFSPWEAEEIVSAALNEEWICSFLTGRQPHSERVASAIAYLYCNQVHFSESVTIPEIVVDLDRKAASYLYGEEESVC